MNAPKRVLSDEISKAITGRRVIAAVFTTYTFDPEFFELEILPILFEGRFRGGFSHVEKVRLVQLEECLRDLADVAVFYDRSGLVDNARSARLDFRRIDVGRTGIFHPKLVLVLVENPASEGSEPTQSLIAATLSANLTRAGWWESVETGHVEVLNSASATNRRCTFRQDLLDALRAVASTARTEDQGGAIETVRRFVQDEIPRLGTRNASWRGRYYTRLFTGQAPLSDWLSGLRLGQRNWNLEIVSPFFDAHGAGTLKNLVRATRPQEVRVFLPTEADGTPTVTCEQYEAVDSIAKWSRFPASVTRSGSRVSSGGTASRRVHAKVYRFWSRGKGDVVLVGSVNLTQAAHSLASAGNLEAAFLVNTTEGSDRADWWLEPLDDPPEQFAEQLTSEDRNSERVGLALSLRYDWARHTFEYRADANHNEEVHLQSIAGGHVCIIHRPLPGEWENCGSEAADSVKELLESSSFVVARTQTTGGKCEWRILIREEGMSHKPSLLTQLTPEEILQYWSLLSESQRQAFLADRLETDEALLGLRPSPATSPVGRVETVFDRFAGVFHAFERLRRWINKRLDEQRETEVTARLFGEKYDSLPVLLRKILERTTRDAVVAYVTLLNAKQVAVRVKREWPNYWAAHRDDGRKLECLLSEVENIRSELKLADPDREEFLTWFEEMFVTDAAKLEAKGDGTP